MRILYCLAIGTAMLFSCCSSPLSAEFAGFEPLEQAVIEGSTEKVEQLLAEGADINHVTEAFIDLSVADFG